MGAVQPEHLHGPHEQHRLGRLRRFAVRHQRLGTLVIAGHTAARKLFAFTDMPLSAMASACSTYVSQNYGANHPDRVRRGMRDIYLYSVVAAVAAILLMAAGAEWMVKLVSGSSEPVVLENGARYLVWNAPFYAVLGMLLSTRYALQSMGEKVLPLLSSVIEFLGKIVFVLLFIPRFGITRSSSASRSSGAS